VSDVVRGLLCARYRLKCPQESYRYEPDRDTGARTFLLRLQPRLARALELECSRTGLSRRQIILETIEAHYKEGE
jgi:predicted HicB family RNase H-like nuclease